MSMIGNDKRTCSKSKLELMSNSSEIFPVNRKFIRAVLQQLNLTKLKFEHLKSEFNCNSRSTFFEFSSLEFDFFRIQLKFAFRMLPE